MNAECSQASFRDAPGRAVRSGAAAGLNGRYFFLYLSLTISILASTETRADSTGVPSLLAIQELSVPAGSGSREPDLFVAADGQLYMSWLEPLDEDETRFALRIATLEETGWAQARTIAEGDNWVVNWADAPSIAAFADGSLAASWRVKNGGSTYFS